MKTYQLSPKLTVASQPALEEFAGLAQDGFTAVINNRPDGEEASQPASVEEEAAARDAGLSYLHLPVGGTPLTEETVRRFQQAVEAAPGPVLAHCRSATRCVNVWAIGEVLDGRMTPEDLGPLGERIGLDLRTAEAWLSWR